MPGHALLHDDEIGTALNGLEGWTGDRNGLTRTITAVDFPTAIAIVDAIAVVAERMNHHPDIDIRWRKVTLSVTTHDAGGVTSLDTTLAADVNALLRESDEGRSTLA